MRRKRKSLHKELAQRTPRRCARRSGGAGTNALPAQRGRSGRGRSGRRSPGPSPGRRRAPRNAMDSSLSRRAASRARTTVGGVAARGEDDHEIAGLREALDLAGKHLVESEIVADAREQRAVGGQRHRGQGTAGLEVAADQLRGEVLCLGPRCRRCRTGAACGRPRSARRIRSPARSMCGRMEERAWSAGERVRRVRSRMPCVGYG